MHNAPLAASRPPIRCHASFESSLGQLPAFLYELLDSPCRVAWNALAVDAIDDVIVAFGMS